MLQSRLPQPHRTQPSQVSPGHCGFADQRQRYRSSRPHYSASHKAANDGAEQGKADNQILLLSRAQLDDMVSEHETETEGLIDKADGTPWTDAGSRTSSGVAVTIHPPGSAIGGGPSRQGEIAITGRSSNRATEERRDWQGGIAIENNQVRNGVGGGSDHERPDSV